MSTPTRSLLSILDDIAVALEPLTLDIEGLQIVPYLNANPTPPSIDIYPGAPFQSGAGFGVGESQLWWTVRARVSTADQEAGQKLLLRMLDPRDSYSVEAALDAADVVVVNEGVTEYREYTEDVATNERLLGAEWRVSTFL